MRQAEEEKHGSGSEERPADPVDPSMIIFACLSVMLGEKEDAGEGDEIQPSNEPQDRSPAEQYEAMSESDATSAVTHSRSSSRQGCRCGEPDGTAERQPSDTQPNRQRA